MIVMPKDYLQVFPSVSKRKQMLNIFICEEKYFAPIEMLYNTLEVPISYYERT